MPGKYDSRRVGKKNDRRYKLAEIDKNMIKLYRKTGWTLSSLAEHFDISVKYVRMILNPEKFEREKVYKKRDKTKMAEYMRSHRQYKKELFENEQQSDSN